MSDQTPRMPNFWWCPTHHLYRGGDKRPCADAVRLVPEVASETEWGFRRATDPEFYVRKCAEEAARSVVADRGDEDWVLVNRSKAGPWTVVES